MITILSLVILAVLVFLGILIYAWANRETLESFFHWSPPNWEHDLSTTNIPDKNHQE